MEDNEWSFCSMWADYARIGCAEALVNNKLEDDYFFNRSKVSGCRDPFAAADVHHDRARCLRSRDRPDRR